MHLVLLANGGKEILAEGFCVLDFDWVGASDMEVERFVAFLPSTVFHEAGATAFDLDSAAGFLLDVFDILPAVADDAGAEVEAGYGLETDDDFLFGPFTLWVYMLVKIPDSGSDVMGISTLPNSSLSIVGSGSLGLLNLLSSTRLGRSCFMSSSILATAFSRPSFVVLVTWRYNGGFCI